MMIVKRLAPLLLLLFGALPARAEPAGYTNQQIIRLSDELTQKLSIEPDKRAIIHGRVARWAADRGQSKFADEPINGVFAYRMGEGGLIVKIMKGKGLLQYYGEDKLHGLRMSSVTAGAEIGGSAEFGVGLVIGPDSPMTMGGEYKMTQVAATAGGASANNAELSKKAGTGSDRIVLLGTANGFSASAGGGSLKIEVLH